MEFLANDCSKKQVKMVKKLLFTTFLFGISLFLVYCKLDTSNTASLPNRSTGTSATAESILTDIENQLTAGGFSASEVNNIKTKAQLSLAASNLEESSDISAIVPEILRGALQGVSDISDYQNKVQAIEILTTCLILSSQSVATQSHSILRSVYISGSGPQYSLAGYADLLKTITSISFKYLDDVGIERENLNTVITVIIKGIIGSLADAGISDEDLPSVTKAVTQGAVSSLDDMGKSGDDIAEAIDTITSAVFLGLNEAGHDSASIADAAAGVAEGAVAALEDAGVETSDVDAVINSVKSGINAGLSDVGLSSEEINAVQSDITDAVELAKSDLDLPEITSFQFLASVNAALSTDVAGTIDSIAKTISLTVPYGTDVTALVATFIASDDTVSVVAATQTSGTTANDFSSSVTYTASASDGATQDYTVSVTIATPLSTKAITAFTFETANNPGLAYSVNGVVNEKNHTIAAILPAGTDVTGLFATFSTTGELVKIGATTQTSGTSSNDFTNTVTYTVTSEDISTQDYAVSVSVTFAQEAYIKASNSDQVEHYGEGVAISGETVVVGARWEKSLETTIINGAGASSDNSGTYIGAAYVYLRNGSLWEQQAYLKAPNAEGDLFGGDVAIDGDTIVVGAEWEESSQTTITHGTNASGDNSATHSGAAYVFVRDGTTWSQQAYLKAPNAEANDLFASSVAISGDTIVIGAVNEDSSQTSITNGDSASSDNAASNSGAVYVFVRDGTTWSQQAYIKAPNADPADYFGHSVAIDGDTIVVAAPLDDSSQATITNDSTASDDNSATDAGAVYVFVRNGTTWSQQAYLKAPNAEAGDGFGGQSGLNMSSSVGVYDDTIVVGSMYEGSAQTIITNGASAPSDNGALNSGAAYVFVRSGTSWNQQAYLKASNAEADDFFGQSVSISGDAIVISSRGDDSSQITVSNDGTASTNNSATDSGAAYLFIRNGTDWSQRAYLKAPNAESLDRFGGYQFGSGVAISGSTIVVGAYAEDSNLTSITNGSTASADNSVPNTGAVYIFR
jgi:FG-GAP repeat protein